MVSKIITAAAAAVLAFSSSAIAAPRALNNCSEGLSKTAQIKLADR